MRQKSVMKKQNVKKIYLKDIKHLINLLLINQFFIDAKKMNILRVFKFGFGCGKIKLIWKKTNQL